MEKLSELPDVAKDKSVTEQVIVPLDWVGMEKIQLPIVVKVQDSVFTLSASLDIGVNLLPQVESRGIHMSRLFLLAQEYLAGAEVNPTVWEKFLKDSLGTHNGLSTKVEATLSYHMPIKRESLKSQLLGWRNYPVKIKAMMSAQEELQLEAEVTVIYSSTCPASAALSRRSNRDQFLRYFESTKPSINEVANWLDSEGGMSATPHAQRSIAQASVIWKKGAYDFSLERLIDSLELALQTPVQTVVKREDEQEFARLNAANTMFCEDAARRVAKCLEGISEVEKYRVLVKHLESLHPHDAVAKVGNY